MTNPSSTRLQELIHRRDKVLAVLHPPTAAHARIMERAGCEALFVGTGGVVNAYTGMARPMSAPRPCPNASRSPARIADSVRIPGDHGCPNTGHGRVMAVRRMVREVHPPRHRRGAHRRPADRRRQAPEPRERWGRTGCRSNWRSPAIAAIDMKSELDPNFVVMAQCYARDAANGGLDDALISASRRIARRPRSIGCSSGRRIRPMR